MYKRSVHYNWSYCTCSTKQSKMDIIQDEKEYVRVRLRIHRSYLTVRILTQPEERKATVVHNVDRGDRVHTVGMYSPSQTKRGRPPWCTTWRVDRWPNFFRRTKKKESKKSTNLDKKYHQVTSRAARPVWLRECERNSKKNSNF